MESSIIPGITVPTRLRTARHLANLTVEELAKKIGVSKSALSKYENGKVSEMKRSTVNAIALATDVNPKWILGESDDMVLSDRDRNVLSSFWDLETAPVTLAPVTPRLILESDDEDALLGNAVKNLIGNDVLLHIVNEAATLPDDKLRSVLTMIKALQ